MAAKVTIATLATASAHGVIVEPPARASGGLNILSPACPGGACLWFNQGTSIGCPKATGGGDVFPDRPVCSNPAKPTIAFGDKELRTYGLSMIYRLEDYTKHHPWRYPGSAGIEGGDPCGLSGGWYTKGAPGNGGEAPPGAPQGELGSTSKIFPKLLEQTVWVAGTTVEVAWGITANHGGGYQYRLCPANQKTTEACFQEHPLDFVEDVTYVQYGNHGRDVNNRTTIPAVIVTGNKVVPAGSTWKRNPIPPCNTPFSGGALNTGCAGGPTFKSPLKGGVGEAYGFGGGSCQGEGVHCTPEKFNKQNFNFALVDKVKIPADLAEGDYVVGFRWESEQTPQIWQSCSDVTIKKSGPATKPFTPTTGCTFCCAAKAPCGNCTGCVNDQTGACAYCYKPLPGYAPGIPPIHCLGHEGEGGKAIDWQPGDDNETPWSPGCTSCWNEGGCEATFREFEAEVTVV
jgi:hypothetical protein